jgi:hypothetical protein
MVILKTLRNVERHFRSTYMLLHSKVTDFQRKSYRTEKIILRLAKAYIFLYGNR